MNAPIIKIEFEMMKETLRVCLDQRLAELDSSIQAALDCYCTPENLQFLVDETVRQSVNCAVKEEVQNLFRFNGHGRKAISEAIKQYADDYWGDN